MEENDKVWLKAVEYFASTKYDVYLARYILLGVQKLFGLETRTFSERVLVETTGWTEYAIRRVLGHWEKMGMIQRKSRPARVVVSAVMSFITTKTCKMRSSFKRPISRTKKFGGLSLKLFVDKQTKHLDRTERCYQEWEIDTNMFAARIDERVRWMKRQRAYQMLSCECETLDISQHMPNESMTEIICNICKHQVLKVKNELVESVEQFVALTNSARSEQTYTWLNERRSSLEQQTLRTEQVLHLPVEQNHDDVVVWVNGITKPISQITESDVEQMSSKEHEDYWKKCQDDETNDDDDEWED